MYKYEIGILAFGSLIDNPGSEIQELENCRIDCLTPFKVEFARISYSRNGAPTLLPILDNSKGKKTNAKIIVLKNNTEIDLAKSVLWRRECHKVGENRKFIASKKPTTKTVMIGEIDNFCDVKKVIYTYFLEQNEFKKLTPEQLADYAISSILSEAGIKKMDGVRYLNSALNHGIKTEYSEAYKQQILDKTGCHTLEDAIKCLDEKRENSQ